jgi:hypothetical protein
MQPFQETRLSLIVRLKNRADQAAWQEFVEIYRPVIVRMAAAGLARGRATARRPSVGSP